MPPTSYLLSPNSYLLTPNSFPLPRPPADRAILVWQPRLLGKEAAADCTAVFPAVRALFALAYAQCVRLFVNVLEARRRELGHRARQRRGHAENGRRRNAGLASVG